MQTTQNNYNYGKKFRKYTYSSIPISFCILALLVVGYSLVNPSVVDGVYAVEDSDSSSIYASDSNEYSNSGVDGGLEEGGDEGSSPSSSPTPTTYDTDNDISSNSGIMPLAYNPSASLTVSNTNLTTQTVPGEVAYLSSNVTYSANDISSYSMKISYAEGNSSLSNSNITDSSGNTTTITGAGGKTPASMSSNSWGYALADTNANNTTLTYNTMPSYGSAATIVSGNAESVPTTTKKVVFASKFATNANPGHYRTKVLLSLTATPRKLITLSQITNMQQMTTQICTDSNVGESKSLADTRDNEKYMVRKHEDGNCWMTQNLRIAGPRTLTPADSDVSKNYTLPKSDLNGFNNSNYYADQLYYDGNKANGAYYSWTTATAGTGDASLTTGSAPSSICPKGWRLPTLHEKGSYTDLLSSIGIPRTEGTTNFEDSAGMTKLHNQPYNFSYTGYAVNSSISDQTAGYYWLRTVSNVEWTQYLYLNSSKSHTTRTGPRYIGGVVRCVATSS